jgi:hypothetical protein
MRIFYALLQYRQNASEIEFTCKTADFDGKRQNKLKLLIFWGVTYKWTVSQQLSAFGF